MSRCGPRVTTRSASCSSSCLFQSHSNGSPPPFLETSGGCVCLDARCYCFFFFFPFFFLLFAIERQKEFASIREVRAGMSNGPVSHSPSLLYQPRPASAAGQERTDTSASNALGQADSTLLSASQPALPLWASLAALGRAMYHAPCS